MSPKRINQYLEHQTREFNDVDGKRWCVRIEQGGGRPNLTRGDPPVARLIFRPVDNSQDDEIAVARDAGNWDLSSYDEQQLRSLLAEAQTRATYPPSE